ncbi:MAG: flavodoxin domain-containing protein [Candidatus Marinimicrobia bacterium]|jgi:menaquinone-dependent protoporphyrinogen IX oxidase|nr:flavodoxin domain-containing protein [Candidatus Neomarinimicrobiota bacterium]MDD5708997.1 flavodoxin domain-containing protein [Candidatus Neomarinimicrobiota bacterium]MDX9778348.1 flavodoxin domain-containing protein [bacterium]
MKGMIVYYSKYGSTRAYAELLADKTGWTARAIKTASKKELMDADVLVLASLIRIGKMPIRKWAKSHASALKKKHLIILATGGNPASEKDYYKQNILKNLGFLNLKPEQCFGLGGRKIRAEMKGMDAFMFNMLEKLPAGPEERDDILRDVDHFDPAGLDRVLDYMKDQKLIQKGRE